MKDELRAGSGVNWTEMARKVIASKHDSVFNGHDVLMAARLLESEIERRRLHTIYLDRLAEQVGYSADAPGSKPGARQLWFMVTATPEQRARAFLEAIKETP